MQEILATLRMPHMVVSGKKAMNQLAKEAFDARSIAVFTDKGVQGAGLLDRPLEVLRSNCKRVHLIQDLPTEPTVEEAQAVIDEFRRLNADLIVAVGGGSVMDIAKLASVLDTDAYTIRDLLSDPTIAAKQVRSVMLPTTAGTGAEATPNAIVLVPEQELKVGIVSASMIAELQMLCCWMLR